MRHQQGAHPWQAWSKGEKIDVGFSGKRCIHSRNCVLGDPRVFVPNPKGQWIHPEAASVDRGDRRKLSVGRHHLHQKGCRTAGTAAGGQHRAHPRKRFAGAACRNRAWR
ncbi:hypothetical protein MES4922_20257 [Mesorhizobium ventifaucium]|uniref:Divergent 4Fe-4S mono-cluster domain-containing protein n=1 Tax=Mesorhizobium ventifaucium TaxID=666020 RepID=A0ABN8JKV1_9HYPH|nr:hypothetical protein MES4922_20257 [Mesorhizobium ventifaucium]